jgi:hypothetical protein
VGFLTLISWIPGEKTLSPIGRLTENKRLTVWMPNCTRKFGIMELAGFMGPNG